MEGLFILLSSYFHPTSIELSLLYLNQIIIAKPKKNNFFGLMVFYEPFFGLLERGMFVLW
jgi:hypothetical protein